MDKDFTVFPAVDLRDGQVVRLELGDPNRQTIFSSDPAQTARRFLSEGARWLHVVNLDGAFGDAKRAKKNEIALRQILEVISQFQGKVQVGGGLRSIKEIERLLEMGVSRVILGTLAVEQPCVVREALQYWGADRIAVSVDLREGKIQTHGWMKSTEKHPEEWLEELVQAGLRWVMVTDVERDGMLGGANLQLALKFSRDSNLRVVLAGGVSQMSDIHQAKHNGLAGVIIGRALYSGQLNLPSVLEEIADAG